MEEQNEKEEPLKNKIFDIFIKCRHESSPDRRQVYFGQLCEQVYKWCELLKKDDMGEEIFNVLRRINKEESKANIPQEKDEFFRYLYASLKTEKAGYHRRYEFSLIRIPKDKNSKLKQIENVIRMEESNLGRKLTYNECLNVIQLWFKLDEHDYHDYIDLLNKKYAVSLSVSGNGRDSEKNNLNSKVPTFPYKEDASVNPQDEYFFSLNKKIICKAVEAVLEKKQERSGGCYKALFTLHCIEIEGLYPVLDAEIINTWQKSGEKPKQKEIYLKYHPKAKGSSAEAIASKMLKDFIRDLEIYLKKNNPEIFS